MSVNNISSISTENLNAIKARASEITSSSDSSIWNEYKNFDANGNGSIADDIDNMSDVDIMSIGEKFGILSDGTVQGTKQSDETGDCYLLSGVNALSNTEWGKQAISNAIEPDGNNGYNVTLYNADGEKETVNITAEELTANPEKYSSGDIDMKIIEVAAEKFYSSHINEDAYSYKNPDSPLTEGLMEGKTSILYMLTGSEGNVLQSEAIDKRIPESALSPNRSALTDETLNKLLTEISSNPDNYASMCSFKKQNFLQKLLGGSNTVSEHGYSIKGVQRNYDGSIESVILQNPWNSSEEITMPYDKFKSQVTYFVTHNPDDTI